MRGKPDLDQLIKKYKDGLRRKRKQRIIFIFFLALIYTISLIFFVLLKPSRNYKKAVNLIKNGNYREADDILTQLDYKDSRKLKKDIQFKDPYEGEIVFWGSYEQDNISDNGKEDLEWIILEMDKTSVLLISTKCIDWIPFHSNQSISWKETYLNGWLQKSFLEEAFTEKEKTHISTSRTGEAISLLSRDEVERYFPQESSRIAYATPYTEAKAENQRGRELKNSACEWWVAEDSKYDDIHLNEYYVPLVENDGEYITCYFGGDGGGGVRPTIWYNLNND